MKSYKLIGLTGPTGAGKSTLCNILLENEAVRIIDADKLARQATEKESTCTAALKAVFGEDIEDENGSIIRSKLAQRAFASKENTQLLNSIVHPWVFLKAFELIKKYGKEGAKYIFFDAPVLFESNADSVCDAVVCVVASQSVRLKRIIKRDGITAEQARLRISAQHSEEFYEEKSDYIIRGDRDLNYLRQEAEKLLLLIN
ncbi:MAG: dephospho-CoA kinase [Acutalibacteraceae bacterium]